MNSRSILVLACMLLAAVCVQAADRVFDVTGVFKARLDDGRVIIDHEEIPDYMPAMTMAFTPADPAEVSGLRDGDAIRFRWRVFKGGSVADTFMVTGRAAPVAPVARGAVRRVREGDAVPAFNLVDENNRPFTQADLLGRNTVITFIFTRCPVPEFCPAMAAKFSAMQDGLVANNVTNGSVRLLSVTLDPEFDIPEILTVYGDAIGANPAIWNLATGTKDEAEALSRAFSVYTERNGALLDHTLCTALIGPDGRVRTIWRGNLWKPEEVLAALGLPAGN
ncbi:MAG TPA: SCO family protein [Opitutaceae bacterium]|nr:SCO family protein [Opitutaceae bacterium]